MKVGIVFSFFRCFIVLSLGGGGGDGSDDGDGECLSVVELL